MTWAVAAAAAAFAVAGVGAAARESVRAAVLRKKALRVESSLVADLRAVARSPEWSRLSDIRLMPWAREPERREVRYADAPVDLLLDALRDLRVLAYDHAARLRTSRATFDVVDADRAVLDALGRTIAGLRDTIAGASDLPADALIYLGDAMADATALVLDLRVARNELSNALRGVRRR